MDHFEEKLVTELTESLNKLTDSINTLEETVFSLYLELNTKPDKSLTPLEALEAIGKLPGVQEAIQKGEL